MRKGENASGGREGRRGKKEDVVGMVKQGRSVRSHCPDSDPLLPMDLCSGGKQLFG